LACVICLGASTVEAVDERILLDATINGKPAHMALDTGATHLILFRQGAERLGLKVTRPPQDVQLGPGQVPLGRTEACDFVLGTGRTRTPFAVFEPPSFLKLGIDGVVGWQPVRYNTIRIDAEQRTTTWLTNTPPETTTWFKLRIRSESRVLTLELPGSDDPMGLLTVDTGSSSGVALRPERWQEWKAAHTNQPVTLMAGYMPGAGTVATEESWAKELALGGLVLTEVPVMPANTVQQAIGAAGFQASLGLAALKRMELIVDGNLGIAYLRPKTGPPPAYEHNRLGAVFVPPNMEGGDLGARVVEGSPAYEAGVRNGDVLLKIGDLDVTKWRTDPAVLPLTRFWERPPGSRLELTLKRGTQTLKITAVLRQILGPGPTSPAR